MRRERLNMNKNYNIKNKFLKNITLESFLLGSFAGTFSRLQAGPLHKAVINNSMTEVFQLLDAGANPNAMDQFGYTPLHIANTSEIVDLLCNAGANINGSDRWGNTPLREAISAYYPNIEVIKALLRQGADKDIPDARGKTSIEAVRDATELGIIQGSRYATLLRINNAARSAYAEVLELFSSP
jgi:ankyrin repeat protein